MADWIRPGADGVMLRVWVVAGSSRTGVVGPHGDALKVQVAAPAEKGRANRALVRLLGERLAPASVELVAGETSRTKTILVIGADVVSVEARLLP